MRAFFLSMCFALLFVATSFGQVKFEMKFKDHSSESVTQVEQKLTINGMDIPTTADNRVTSSSKVTREANGEIHVTDKIDSMQLTSTGPGFDYSFDSANPDKAGTSPLEIVRDAHKALAKRSVTRVFDKEHKLTSVKPDQDYLGALPINVQGLVKSEFDPEQLKKAALQEVSRLPTEAVSNGDTWDRTESANFGAGQVMKFLNRYTYEGQADKNGKQLDKITVKCQSVDFSLEGNELPLQLKSSSLKTEDETSVIWFDRDQGAVVEAASSARITGEIIFIAGGNDLPAKLDLKIVITTTRK